MRGLLKTLVATTALVVPVAVGWVYTAGATVGDGGSPLDTFFEDETVDEFAVDDFLITRESHNGVVSMSVVGPDGTEVDLGSLPSAIAERVSFYESEWTPALSGPVFESDGGVTCYLLPEDLSPGADLGVVEDNNDTTRVFAASVDGDGDVDVRAFEFDNDGLSAEERQALREDGVHVLDDLTGGTELSPCDG